MINRRNIITLLSLLLLSVLSCDAPSKHDYIDLNSKNFLKKMPLEFTLDMNEINSAYDIYISSRINTHSLTLQRIDFDLTLISPANDTSVNSGSLPILSESYSIEDRKVVSVIKTGTIYDFEWLYLHDVSISEAGKWRILIDIQDKNTLSTALMGFGIKYEQQR